LLCPDWILHALHQVESSTVTPSVKCSGSGPSKAGPASPAKALETRIKREWGENGERNLFGKAGEKQVDCIYYQRCSEANQNVIQKVVEYFHGGT